MALYSLGDIYIGNYPITQNFGDNPQNRNPGGWKKESVLVMGAINIVPRIVLGHDQG